MTGLVSADAAGVSGNDPLEIARVVLSDFVMTQAITTAERLGFGWTAVTGAPSTFDEVTAALTTSLATGAAFPVSSENSDSVVYLTPAVNHAMRFWHDVGHAERELSFGPVDELELALWHLGELGSQGHARGSLVWQLLHADLVGSIYALALGHSFPSDQRRFAEGCVRLGFDTGLLDELRSDRP